MDINALLGRLPDPLRTLFDHNRFTALSAVLGMIVAGCTFFGEPKTESPVTGKNVTQNQLVAEAETWAIAFKARQDALDSEAQQMEVKFGGAFDDLDVKRQKNVNLAQFATDAAGKYIPGPVGAVATGLIALLTAGLFADNRRKDVIITSRTGRAATIADEQTATDTATGCAVEPAAGAADYGRMNVDCKAELLECRRRVVRLNWLVLILLAVIVALFVFRLMRTGETASVVAIAIASFAFGQQASVMLDRMKEARELEHEQ